MLEKLHALFEYYLAHQEEFVEKYNHKVIVLKDNQVIGVYDSESVAYFETIKDHQLGTFMIQVVSPGPSGYTINVIPNYVVAGV